MAEEVTPMGMPPLLDRPLLDEWDATTANRYASFVCCRCISGACMGFPGCLQDVAQVCTQHSCCVRTAVIYMFTEPYNTVEDRSERRLCVSRKGHKSEIEWKRQLTSHFSSEGALVTN